MPAKLDEKIKNANVAIMNYLWYPGMHYVTIEYEDGQFVIYITVALKYRNFLKLPSRRNICLNHIIPAHESFRLFPIILCRNNNLEGEGEPDKKPFIEKWLKEDGTGVVKGDESLFSGKTVCKEGVFIVNITNNEKGFLPDDVKTITRLHPRH